MKFRTSRWPLILLSLLVVLDACRDNEPDADEGEREGELDADKDNATLRRRAMNEWYTESESPPGQEAWSREYRQYILEEAKAERQRWGRLLPSPGDRFKVPLVGGTTWTNMGPTQADVLKNGSTTLHVTDSGRIRSIIPDGATIYVATAGGGVWRTSDGGATWIPLTESLGTLSCGSLAMDPANHATLYLGLGDPFDGTGIGLVKSTDQGNTWSNPVYLGDSTVIAQVLVSPASSSIVLAATNKGLYRSTDAGASWSLVSLATGQSVAPQVWSIASTGGSNLVLSLEANPVATSGTTDGQVWTSANNGASWTRATGFTTSSGVGRATVASAPSNPQTVYAYAAIPLASSASDLADIFKSTNGGQSWTALGKSSKRYTNANTESRTLATLLNGQGWYNQLVIVNPTNPNQVYFGGALLLARTNDGGSTYTQVSNWLAQFSLPYVHADFHAGAFGPNGELYVGSDGGLFRSTDGGASFTDTLNRGMVTHLLYSVGSSVANRDAVIGGMQDNGTRVRVGTSSVFNEYIGGDGFGSDIHKTNATMMLGSLYYDRIYKSTDSGLTFASASSGITESNNSSSAPFITRIYAWDGSATGNDVYTFSNLKVYKSTNYAGSWTALPAAPLTSGAIRHIGVAKGDSQKVGVVASGGRVLISTNGGSSWTTVATGKRDDSPQPVPAPLPNSMLSLSYISFDPIDSNIVYVASVAPDESASHLWKSTNSGASWTIIDGGGLPAGVPVNVIKPDPSETAPGQALYAGTHMGVYKSTDGGTSWTRLGAGMPLVSVMDLYISPDASLVRAASYGRGFWELGGGTPPASDFSIGASPSSVSAVQGGGASTTITTAVTSGSAQSVSLAVTAGLPTSASASFSPTSVTSGGSSTLTLTAGAATPAGTYSLTVTGTSATATHTTTVSFTVTAPVSNDFSMSASPSSVSAVQGSGTSTTIGTQTVSGSAQSVSLAVTAGLPAGASASFSPTSVTSGGSSTLTLTAGAATPTGTYSLTVTGTGTSATHTTSVSFTVTAPVVNDFSMSGSSATVVQGGTTTATVSTAVTSGSAQTVDLAITSSLPAGVTASLSPASVTAGGSSTMTIVTTASAAAGSYGIVVTGTGTSATHTATVNLTINPTSGETVLTNGVAVTNLSGATGSQQFFRLDVPAGTMSLSFTMSGGTGDADMYVKFGTKPTLASYDCRPFVSGNNETCNITSIQAGTYYVMLNGYAAYSGVSLVGSYTQATVLENNVPVTGIAGAKSSKQYWQMVSVPAGVSVTISISGGTGDADLYVRRGAVPTTASYDCRPFLTGNNETCTLTNPAGGSAADYFIMLNGYQSYSGVTLSGSY